MHVSLPEGLTILGPPLSLEFWPPPPDTPNPPDTPDTRLGTRRQGPGPAMTIPEPLWKYQVLPWRTGFSWVLYHWKYGFHGFRNERRFETMGVFSWVSTIERHRKMVGKTTWLISLMFDDWFWLVVWNMTFIFPYIGNNHPNWLIFFRGVETTNQILDSISRYQPFIKHH